MSKINFILDDKIEENFRKAIFKSMGMKKGNISLALTEAIQMWITYQSKKKSS